MNFIAPPGSEGSGYAIAYTADANGNPQTQPNANIAAGRYDGFKGLITPYTIIVTARSPEVRLRAICRRSLPVFQFGLFSETDLTFCAGDDFNCRVRVQL
jgi:hypothetical protein